MNPCKDHISIKSVIKTLSYTFLFDTLIALFLTAIGYGEGFPINFIISQSIGLSICTCVMIALHFFPSDRPIWQTLRVAVALMTGGFCGSYLGAIVYGLGTSILFEKTPLFQLLTIGVIFGSIISYFFNSREQIAESQAQAQEEKIKRLTSEKKAAEANLQLLQAQIEPHFLFNTLSNILSLLDTDSEKGKSMLVDFIQYLRVVFITAFDQYAIEAFENEAVDYLLKPVTAKRLAKTINRLKKQISEISPPIDFSGTMDRLLAALKDKQPSKYLKWIKVRHGEEIRLISIDEVCYFKAEDKYTLVRTLENESLIKKNIRQLAEELDPEHFWRIHRGSIINANRIAGVHRSFAGRCIVKLKELSETLTVSRSYAHLFKQM